jgi:hypothetical protein
VLAHTFHDPDMVAKETERLQGWINAIGTESNQRGKL